MRWTIDRIKEKLNNLDAERNRFSRMHNEALGKRTPEEWQNLIIEACPDSRLRAQVARLVAFDYGFSGGGGTTEDWSKNFDKYMVPNTVVYGAEVSQTLQKLGYTIQKAQLRSYPGNSRPVDESTKTNEQIKQLQSDLAEATNELNQQDRGGRERPDGGGGSGIPFYPHERKLGYLITNKEK